MLLAGSCTFSLSYLTVDYQHQAAIFNLIIYCINIITYFYIFVNYFLNNFQNVLLAGALGLERKNHTGLAPVALPVKLNP